MRSRFSEKITSLADTKLTLLRGGEIQLYRVEKSGASVLAVVPVSGELGGALTQLRYEYDIGTALKHSFAVCYPALTSYETSDFSTPSKAVRRCPARGLE
jgi:hypothetical protein